MIPEPEERLPEVESPVPLREMSIGQILDSAIKLYRSFPKMYLAITAVFMVPALALQSIMMNRIAPDFGPGFTPGEMGNGEALRPEQMQALFTLSAVGVVFYLLVMPLVTGALARVTSSIYLGRAESLGGTVRFALSKFWAVLAVDILVFVSVMAGFFLLIIPGIVFLLRLLLAPIAVVVEGKQGTGAVGRSWRLTKGSMGKIFLTTFLAGILSFIVQAILGIPFGIIAGAVGGAAGDVLDFVGQVLATVISTPFTTIVLVLLYFDMRIRKEGFDLEIMSQEIGQFKA